MRKLKWLLVLAPLALAGCHLRHTVRADTACGLGIRYDKATSVAPVKTADGLAQPNVHNVLKIPDIPATAQAAAANRRSARACLDEPPKFIEDKGKPAAAPAGPRPPPSTN